MIRLTKDALHEIGIYNSWDINHAVDNRCYVEYMPAENGMLAHYAEWRVYVFKLYDQPIANLPGINNQLRYAHKDFTVTCRENKQPVLEEVMKWIKQKFDVDCSDKDPFGAYHPKGTLDKIMEIRRRKLGL